MFVLVWEQLAGSSVEVKHICGVSFPLLVVLCSVIYIPHCSLQFFNLQQKGIELELLDPRSLHLLYWMYLTELKMSFQLYIRSSLLKLGIFWRSHCSAEAWQYFHVIPSHRGLKKRKKIMISAKVSSCVVTLSCVCTALTEWGKDLLLLL